MPKKTASQIRFEMGQIDKLFITYSDLLAKTQDHAPDVVELAALAAVLHSFYNGLENIFLRVAKRIDNHVPGGSEWHHELLMRMTHETPNRCHVISQELYSDLEEYLKFRHFVRHGYTFLLNWGRFDTLVARMQNVWSQTKAELEIFLVDLAARYNTAE